MRIAIDVDQTISDTSAVNYVLAKTFLDLKNKEIILDKSQLWPEFRYGIIKHGLEEEFLAYTREFYKNNPELFQPVKDSVKYVNKLKEDGQEIHILTARKTLHFYNPYKETEQWLNVSGFKFDKLAVDCEDKDVYCKNNKIDIFVDDLESKCLMVSKTKTQVINIVNKKDKTHPIAKFKTKKITQTFSWRQTYKVICNLIKQKKTNAKKSR